MERDTSIVVHFDPSLRVGRQGKSQRLLHVLSERPQPGEAGAELAVESRPGDALRALELPQSIGKPDVEVDRHTAVSEPADRGFADRERMLDQRVVERLVENDALPPQRELDARVVRPGRQDRVADEATVGDLACLRPRC